MGQTCDEKDKKYAAKQNGDFDSNHLDSKESKDSNSSDPGDKEGNERDKKQDQRMLAKPWFWRALSVCCLNKLPKWEKQFENKPGPRFGAMTWQERMRGRQTCRAVPAWWFPKRFEMMTQNMGKNNGLKMGKNNGKSIDHDFQQLKFFLFDKRLKKQLLLTTTSLREPQGNKPVASKRKKGVVTFRTEYSSSTIP